MVAQFAAIAARAAAENSDRAGLLGVPVKQVSTVLWIVGGALVAGLVDR